MINKLGGLFPESEKAISYIWLCACLTESGGYAAAVSRRPDRQGRNDDACPSVRCGLRSGPSRVWGKEDVAGRSPQMGAPTTRAPAVGAFPPIALGQMAWTGGRPRKLAQPEAEQPNIAISS